LEKKREEAAQKKDAFVGGIKHKPVERMSLAEKRRLREEQLAQKKAGKKGQASLSDRSRSGTPNGPGKPAAKKQTQELSYKGTMKKPAEPLNYKGTMRAAGSGPKPAAKKGMPQDKYGGYASWSDLDEVEDEEEEDGYESEGSDDMEAGFDDVETEESAALRAARKEDQEALEEEARLKREKLERQRKLQALIKNAASKKKY
jgi:hypothetical protein